MSRILKRPMFKRGGQSNDGIMSNVVDREQKSSGDIAGRVAKLTPEFEKLLSEYTPRTRLPLGEVGFLLASGADPIEALGKGYSKFTKADDARQAAIKSGALKLGIAQATKEPTISKTKSVYDTVKKANVLASDKQIQAEPDRYLPAIKKESLTFKSGVDTRTGKRGYFTNEQILESKGAIQPIDNRMAFTFDSDTNTLTQLPISERDRVLDNKAKATAVVSSVNTLKELKNNMLTRLDDTPTGAVAAVYGVIEGTSDQFSQGSQALGFTNQNLKFDRSNSEKLDAYLESKGITKGAANFAAMKSSVINLAYILAKIKEPLNPRLSEGDIIRQMNRINFGASKDVFAKSLNQIFEDELISARGQIRGYDLNPDDFFETGEEKKSTSGATDTKKDNDPLNIR